MQPFPMSIRPRSGPRGRTKRTAGAVLFLTWMGVPAPLLLAGERHRWTFQDDPVGEPARDWEVLSGTWEVRPSERGDSRILVQVGPLLPGLDLPAILAPVPPLRDLRATVKLKPVGRGTFETMGLIIRWRDPGTMTIVRVEGTPGRVGLMAGPDGRVLLDDLEVEPAGAPDALG